MNNKYEIIGSTPIPAELGTTVTGAITNLNNDFDKIGVVYSKSSTTGETFNTNWQSSVRFQLSIPETGKYLIFGSAIVSTNNTYFSLNFNIAGSGNIINGYQMGMTKTNLDQNVNIAGVLTMEDTTKPLGLVVTTSSNNVTVDNYRLFAVRIK